MTRTPDTYERAKRIANYHIRKKLRTKATTQKRTNDEGDTD